MPFDANGIFARVHRWADDEANAIDIRSDRMDAEDDGFAAGLSLAVLRDGRGIMTANLNLGSNKIVNVANPTGDQDAATKKWTDDTFLKLANSGGINNWGDDLELIADFANPKQAGFYKWSIDSQNGPSGGAGGAISIQRAGDGTAAGAFGWLAADTSGSVGSNAPILWYAGTSGNGDLGTWSRVAMWETVNTFKKRTTWEMDNEAAITIEDTVSSLSYSLASRANNYQNSSIVAGSNVTTPYLQFRMGGGSPRGSIFFTDADSGAVFIDPGNGYIGTNDNTGSIHLYAANDKVRFRGPGGIFARHDNEGTSIGGADYLLTRQQADGRYERTSSKRFKENIRTSDLDHWDIISRTETKGFTWGGELAPTDERFGTDSVAPIAEEAEQIDSRLVRYHWKDENGGAKQVAGLDTLVYISALIECVRDLEKRI